MWVVRRRNPYAISRCKAVVMKLNEALRVIASARDQPAGPTLWLVCGFEPLHLKTFLQAAYLQRAVADRIEVATGAFGDVEGNLKRAVEAEAALCGLVLELNDLDPRLGVRSRGPWSGKRQQEVLVDVEARLARLRDLIADANRRAVVAICPPTLPWLLSGSTPLAQHSRFELGLQRLISAFTWEVGQLPGVRVMHPETLAELSPRAARHDTRSELGTSFPYTLPHASALASLLLSLLFPETPKKALITDLDDTLWAGLIGEDGADGVFWTQENGAQVHGLYQSQLRQLIDSGALVGVASKNDPVLARDALARSGLFVAPEELSPVQVSWSPKSHAVSNILAHWNIAADAVVFVDDSAMELDEVARSHPKLTCKRFPTGNPAEVLSLLVELRDLFGAPFTTEDDRLRGSSLRDSAAFLKDLPGDVELGAFLASLMGQLCFARDAQADLARAHQLINKTNQFNLNGVRTSEPETRALVSSHEQFLLLAHYTDRYGPLGNVGLVAGRLEHERLVIEHWVLSCRAFSRNVEHHMLHEVFELARGRAVVLDYRETPSNGPLRCFLEGIGLDLRSKPLRLGADVPRRLEPLLPHTVNRKAS
jgi:FkbH-like protein